jgi:uncharacterized protein YjiS (DUF1127 family)
MTELPNYKAFQGAVMTELPVFLRHASSVPASWRPIRRRFPHGAAARLIHAFRGLASAYRRWRVRQQAIAELSRLDDMALADIGLHRCEIRSAVFDVESPSRPRERRIR